MTVPLRSARRNKTAQAYILIGDGFDELEVVFFLHKFRQAGLPIKSVSLFDELVHSRQGVCLQADIALADSPVDTDNQCLLILPAGGRNGEVLRRDARVKSLLQDLDESRADIVVTDSSSNLFADVGQLLDKPAFRPGFGQTLDEFVDQLTRRIA